jgi:hypothetical protein
LSKTLWFLVFVLVLVNALPLRGQSNSGELRLTVVDSAGRGVRTTVQILSEGSQYRNTLRTSDEGQLDVQPLAFGIYRIDIEQPGFAPVVEAVAIRSSLPVVRAIQLRLATVNQSVTVSASSTLVDPDRSGSVSQIGSEVISHRLGSIPGRSLEDLVNSQPGWLYEGNAVLHPRGSEYQTQFVIDGIPLADNRSPGFGPAIEADDVESMSIYTAGIPAEYGRKMGGVVEVNTVQNAQSGLHGAIVLSGGSFDSAGASARGQYTAGPNTIGASASGSMTDHYLNPVVPQNYSNTGTLASFSARYQRELTQKHRFNLALWHELSRYDIPNEQVQQAAGQRQTANNIETMGAASWQHIFSPRTLAEFHGMARDNASDFGSNPQSTPIEVFQHNHFREAWFNSALTAARAHNQWKFGVESDNIFLHENFSYNITDPSQFDPATPLTFSFAGQRPELDQAAWLEDSLHFGAWNINAGLRWDHYQLLLNQQAVSPRVSISRFFSSANTVVHFSWDRVFQTPAFENILLSNSTQIESLDPSVFLRLPVQPSRGDYFEGGVTQGFSGKLRLDANYFRRDVDNYADDDQIENTAISFPIAFRKAIIYGAEGKLDVPDWHRFSGFLSYSWQVGNAWNPVTGGLFLGDNATQAETQLTGHFPDSQDQRNTARGRLRWQVRPRFWIASGAQYDSGLPFEFDGNPATVLAEYGQQVLDRIDFDRGRILPAFQVNASAGAVVRKTEHLDVELQADGQNLTNVLDVLDFGGLFSGNAIGPARSFSLRLNTSF